MSLSRLINIYYRGEGFVFNDSNILSKSQYMAIDEIINFLNSYVVLDLMIARNNVPSYDERISPFEILGSVNPGRYDHQLKNKNGQLEWGGELLRPDLVNERESLDLGWPQEGRTAPNPIKLKRISGENRYYLHDVGHSRVSATWNVYNDAELRELNYTFYCEVSEYVYNNRYNRLINFIELVKKYSLYKTFCKVFLCSRTNKFIFHFKVHQDSRIIEVTENNIELSWKFYFYFFASRVSTKSQRV